jgi:His-Xaa-Ser repeat protein HxsA
VRWILQLDDVAVDQPRNQGNSKGRNVMHKSLTALGSALTALQGLAPDQTALDSKAVARVFSDSDSAVVLALPLNAGVRNMYAGHRSHSSHSSHSSHYSGSGGGYAPAAAPVAPIPAPAYPSATPSTSPRSTGSAPAGLLAAPPNAKPSADQLQKMIMRVQAALYSKEYDPGAIDGVLTPATTTALRRYQLATHLTVSGTMSTETLNALGISLTR